MLVFSRRVFLAATLCLFIAAPLQAGTQPGIAQVMDDMVTRLYATMSPAELRALGEDAVMDLLTAEERQALATEYWTFSVDVPVTVSILRHVEQQAIPYWLPEAGFEKTELRARNEMYEYEIWRKDFEPGRVALGINGFDKHRPHYLVAVGPRGGGATPEIHSLYPPRYDVLELRPGALMYHDWTELVLTDAPEELLGHALLTTVRGRAREAHLAGAFRETPHPSSPAPDQVALTWNGDTRTTRAVQWRTDTSVTEGAVRFREKFAAPYAAWSEVRATHRVVQDRMLMNDRYVHRFSATLDGLAPDTSYVYVVGSERAGQWSPEAEFKTGPADENAPFTFVYFGDTHRSEAWGRTLDAVFDRYPGAAFFTLAGDLVGTGLDRNDWDEFFHLSSPVFSRRPVVPCIGNHDDQDGLGCAMYLDAFALPENGPAGIEPQRAYTLEYANALFVILDIGSPEDVQAAWMEEQLAGSDATWKFAMFHFPPYAPDEDYENLRTVWGAVFDKYEFDLVMSGHVHYYLRTHPMRGGKPAEAAEHGTIYVTSVAVPYAAKVEAPDYAAAAKLTGPPLYQVIRIEGNRLAYEAWDASGEKVDELLLEK